jgi:hypothetical protein
MAGYIASAAGNRANGTTDHRPRLDSPPFMAGLRARTRRHFVHVEIPARNHARRHE